MRRQCTVRNNLLRSIRFGAAVAIVTFVAAAAGCAQQSTTEWMPAYGGKIPTEFTPTPEVGQTKFDARSSPAKVTTDDEAALVSKGYRKIGLVNAFDNREDIQKISPKVTQMLNEITLMLDGLVLARAARVGGDVVRFEQEGSPVLMHLPKFKKTCAETHTWTSHGTTASGTEYERKEETCTKWESEEAGTEEKGKIIGFKSEGTVWRYDAQLAAKMANGAPVRTLLKAAGAHDLATVARLLENDPDLAHNATDENGYSALDDAAEEGNLELVELLVARGADVNAKGKYGCSPLCTLSERDYDDSTQVAEFLLAKGADVNAKDEFGDTPLHKAAESERKNLVTLLLAKGADVNAKDRIGRTPLHLAAEAKGTDAVALLLGKGVDVNVKDNDGDTPLNLAVRSGSRDVAKLLLDKGANVNARDRYGDTPLQQAICPNLSTHVDPSVDMVELLVDSGADVNARDHNGGTTLAVAEVFKDKTYKDGKKIVKLLKEHGARE
jgi:ankyrin repeat protein